MKDISFQAEVECPELQRQFPASCRVVEAFEPAELLLETRTADDQLSEPVHQAVNGRHPGPDRIAEPLLLLHFFHGPVGNFTPIKGLQETIQVERLTLSAVGGR